LDGEDVDVNATQARCMALLTKLLGGKGGRASFDTLKTYGFLELVDQYDEKYEHFDRLVLDALSLQDGDIEHVEEDGGSGAPGSSGAPEQLKRLRAATHVRLRAHDSPHPCHSHLNLICSPI
jgi:hypothetical protein